MRETCHVIHTLGTAPGWILLRTLQRIIPLRNPILKSSSDGSAGKSFPPTTPTIFLSQPAASYLLKAAIQYETKCYQTLLLFFLGSWKKNHSDSLLFMQLLMMCLSIILGTPKRTQFSKQNKKSVFYKLEPTLSMSFTKTCIDSHNNKKKMIESQNQWNWENNEERGYIQASSAFLDAKLTSHDRTPCCWRTSSTTETTENGKTCSLVIIRPQKLIKTKKMKLLGDPESNSNSISIY